MKQIAILILFICVCLTGTSQTRKLPQLGMPNQTKPDTSVVNAGVSKVKIVAFVPRKHNKLDTDYVFYITYDAAGYLKQTENYGYDSELHKVDPDYERLSGKLYDRYTDCSRIDYRYDDHHNLLEKMSYHIYPAGSYEAFFEGVGDIVNRRMKTNNKEVTQETIQQIGDSLKKEGIPEREKEGRFSMYKYDSDGNMVYSRDEGDERHYTYVHDGDGRVHIMREVYNRDAGDMITAETWLTYTPEGWPATITTYLGHGDTGHVAIENHNIMKKEELSYNTYGQPVRILTSNSGKLYHKAEIMTYTGDEKMSDLVYEVNREAGRYDTTTYTTFAYRKGLREATTRKYNYNKVVRIEREEVYLDDKGLQTKVRQYAKPGARPEVLTNGLLSFYSK